MFLAQLSQWQVCGLSDFVRIHSADMSYLKDVNSGVSKAEAGSSTHNIYSLYVNLLLVSVKYLCVSV